MRKKRQIFCCLKPYIFLCICCNNDSANSETAPNGTDSLLLLFS